MHSPDLVIRLRGKPFLYKTLFSYLIWLKDLIFSYSITIIHCNILDNFGALHYSKILYFATLTICAAEASTILPHLPRKTWHIIREKWLSTLSKANIVFLFMAQMSHNFMEARKLRAGIAFKGSPNNIFHYFSLPSTCCFKSCSLSFPQLLFLHQKCSLNLGYWYIIIITSY